MGTKPDKPNKLSKEQWKAYEKEKKAYRKELKLYGELNQFLNITIPNNPSKKVLNAYDVSELKIYDERLHKFFRFYIKIKKKNELSKKEKNTYKEKESRYNNFKELEKYKRKIKA